MFQYALSAPLPPHYQKAMTVQQCILRAAAPISSYNEAANQKVDAHVVPSDR